MTAPNEDQLVPLSRDKYAWLTPSYMTMMDDPLLLTTRFFVVAFPGFATKAVFAVE